MTDAIPSREEYFAALCRTKFDVFAERAFRIIEPGGDFEYSWHLGCIAEHLEANLRREIPWLIINIPPRCLKSVLVAQLYPAWVLGRDPSHQFIGAAYAHTLAERNVMRTRQILDDAWYRALFPAVQISADQNQKDYFTTTRAGQYKGTGIGGTVTGFGCHTLLIDDPINPKESGSDTVRANTNNEIRSTLFSRFNDRRLARMVMIMQRVHENDPTGNLMADSDGRYYLLKLPAEAKSQIVVNLGAKSWAMAPGDLLTPRLPRAELDDLRLDLTEYHYAGQYLQEPVPVGGGEFREEWIEYYSDGGVQPKTMNIYITVDPSGGEDVNRKRKKLSDWTAMMVIGLAPDNNYYLLDIVRDRLNPTERVDTLFMLHRKWNELGGKPPKVGYEKYGMMTDTHYIKAKQAADGYRFPIVELGGTMAKEERIRRLIPDMQNGRWWLPTSLHYCDGEGRTFDLVRELVSSEMPTFPRARFDDMLDALSRIYDDTIAPIWPSKKPTMASKAMRRTADSGADNWMSF